MFNELKDKSIGYVAVPHGWKLVPIEPTPEMEAIGDATYLEWENGHCVSEIYRAMVGAAPSTEMKKP